MTQQQKWLKGFVKEVQSADSITITNYGIPPIEKRMTFSSIICPRLAKQGMGKDEPFAWDGREYLRKLAIGRECIFSQEYNIPNVQRDFGSVVIQLQDGTQVNLAKAVVSEGLAKVRKDGQNQSSFLSELVKAEQVAQTASKGLWNQDPDIQANAVRPVKSDTSATDFVAAKGRGSSVACVVELVITGSLVRVTTLDSTFNSFSVLLTGIQSPSNRPQSVQNGTQPQQLQPQQSIDAEKANGNQAANGKSDSKPLSATAPSQGRGVGLGMEAKLFTERQILHRDVIVQLDGVDQSNQGGIYGTITYKNQQGNTVNLALQLLALGYARIIEGSIRQLAAGVKLQAQYRQAEIQAKNSHLRIWKDFVQPQSDNQKSFVGRVIEIVSVDTMVLLDLSNQQEVRVSLASIRGPTIKRAEQRADPYFFEARDFLRKKLIGRDVQATIEYERKISPTLSSSNDDVLLIKNVNVLFEEKGKDGKTTSTQIAELVVRQAFANPVRHGNDDMKSSIYDQLLIAEEEAKTEKLNIHNPSTPKELQSNSNSRGTDLSTPGTGDRAKHFLGALQRGKQNAICEYILAGHRVRLFLPTQQVTIAFSLSGIRSPARPMPARGKLPAQKGEPYAEEAYNFTRHHVLQRNVQVEIDTVDRVGSFLGTLEVPLSQQWQQQQFEGKTVLNLGLELLSRGLGAVHPGFPISRLRMGAEYQKAQTQAKQKKLKIWENYEEVEEQESVNVDQKNIEKSLQEQEGQQVTVTEILDASTFFIQNAKDQQVKQLSDILAGLSIQDQQSIAQGSGTLQRNKRCLARSMFDQIWYRGFIESVEKGGIKYKVYLLDIGSTETLSPERIRKLDPNLEKIKAQAQMCKLAYIRCPKPQSQYGGEAIEYVAKTFPPGSGSIAIAKTQFIERVRVTHPQFENGIRHVVMYEQGESYSINEKLVQMGYGVSEFNKVKPIAGVTEMLEAAERQARSRHLGIFEHGDPGDSDDEV